MQRFQKFQRFFFQARLGIWTKIQEEDINAQTEQATIANMERVVNYKKVVVTDVQKGNLRFAAQCVDDGKKFC